MASKLVKTAEDACVWHGLVGQSLGGRGVGHDHLSLKGCCRRTDVGTVSTALPIAEEWARLAGVGVRADEGLPKVIHDGLARPRLKLKYSAFAWTVAFFMMSSA
ncbi:unnamed protein product [Prunus armeniaca]